VIALLADFTARTVALGAGLAGALAGLAGAFAFLRRQSLLGDTLAHAALPGVCIGFLVAGTRSLPALMAGALMAGLAAAVAVTLIARGSRLKPDAALAIVLSLFFAAGVVLLTHIQATAGAGQAGLETFLFGQAAAMLPSDVVAIGVLAAGAALAVAVLWRPLKLATFDPALAAVQGLPLRRIEIALAALIAVAVVAGVQLVGVVLMTALIVAPAAAARQWTRSLGAMVALSAAFGATAGVVGALISAGARGLSTGPLIVLVATGIVAVSFLAAPGRGAIAAALRMLANRRNARRAAAGVRVLGSLGALARAHADPAYPVERGMIEALHGRAVRDTLARLEAEGLVRPVDHAPETTPHWELTAAGRAALSGLPRGRAE
jgi:manganese/zinc/iron transport system permease protein